MFDLVNSIRPCRWLLGRRRQTRFNEMGNTPGTHTQHGDLIGIREQRVEPRSEVHSTGATGGPGLREEMKPGCPLIQIKRLDAEGLARIRS